MGYSPKLMTPDDFILDNRDKDCCWGQYHTDRFQRLSIHYHFPHQRHFDSDIHIDNPVFGSPRPWGFFGFFVFLWSRFFVHYYVVFQARPWKIGDDQLQSDFGYSLGMYPFEVSFEVLFFFFNDKKDISNLAIFYNNMNRSIRKLC